MSGQSKKEPRAVLLSISPQWCDLIIKGKKTAELRKTAPRMISTPFKAYIYCTKKQTNLRGVNANKTADLTTQKVIGEFVCDNIYFGNGYDIAVNPEKAFLKTHLTMRQIKQYLKIPVGAENDRNFYEKYSFAVWHISELKIYDNPKTLADFGLKCPPQSWCYIYKL